MAPKEGESLEAGDFHERQKRRKGPVRVERANRSPEG